MTERSSMLRRVVPASLVSCALLASGCGQDEVHLSNRLDWGVTVEVLAPRATLRGGCATPFATRFCAEEYEVIGALDVSAHNERVLGTSDPVKDDQCTNVLWLRLLRLGDVGPVDDPGTLIEMPTDTAIEQGAGALHTVAFPQATVRIDEVGLSDAHQARPPETCAALGRTAR